MQEAALALVPGVDSAAGNGSGEEEEEEELLSPAERRAKRLADAAARPPIYNAEAMHEKLEDISWPSEVLALSCPVVVLGPTMATTNCHCPPVMVSIIVLPGYPESAGLCFPPMRLLVVQAAWDESLVITGEDTAQVENIDDDLSRELAFYNQVCTVDADRGPLHG